jgi:hypothetical protein
MNSNWRAWYVIEKIFLMIINFLLKASNLDVKYEGFEFSKWWDSQLCSLGFLFGNFKKIVISILPHNELQNIL